MQRHGTHDTLGGVESYWVVQLAERHTAVALVHHVGGADHLHHSTAAHLCQPEPVRGRRIMLDAAGPLTHTCAHLPNTGSVGGRVDRAADAVHQGPE